MKRSSHASIRLSAPPPPPSLSCDGCWARVCEGKIQETRYETNRKTDKLEMTSDNVFEGKRDTNRHLLRISDSIMYCFRLLGPPLHGTPDDAPTFINNALG
jgi:hypothetical protein